VPSSWTGRDVYITFDGVEAAFYVWVNGERVGYSEDSRTPAEFNITKYLKDGENLLAVEVYRWCDGSYLEDQDFWRLSGIFRDVTLWSARQLHVRDLQIRTDLDAACNDAFLNIEAQVRNGRTRRSRSACAQSCWTRKASRSPGPRRPRKASRRVRRRSS